MIRERPVDGSVNADLGRIFPTDGERFRSVGEGCDEGIAAGWMCNRKGVGIKYGRFATTSAASHGFSLDVMKRQSSAGPQHREPNGEIDTMPPTRAAIFDGPGAGWLVHLPGGATQGGTVDVGT